MRKQDYCNDFFEIGQQKINFSFFELSLPDDDPVYTLKKVMEDLDFSGLLACYFDKGRTGFNPIMLYSVVTYANMRGVSIRTVLQRKRVDKSRIYKASNKRKNGERTVKMKH